MAESGKSVIVTEDALYGEGYDVDEDGRTDSRQRVQKPRPLREISIPLEGRAHCHKEGACVAIGMNHPEMHEPSVTEPMSTRMNGVGVQAR